MTQIWPKGPFFNFAKKCENVIFSTAKTRISTKNLLENSNERIAKKAKNLHFWTFWDKMANFGSFWPKWAKWELKKKRLEHFSLAYKP